jgi:hypothetical protein
MERKLSRDIFPPEVFAEWLPPLRVYWRRINQEKQAQRRLRRERKKTVDRARPKCRCEAYPWPHRPKGGLCRFPDPPVERWCRPPRPRPYRDRHTGTRRQIVRANGLNPIKDRCYINSMLPLAVLAVKDAKRTGRRCRYRNVEIIWNAVHVHDATTGPEFGTA